ncbi:N-6 DNA methylase [Nocardiopsis sp. FR4]|uniref:N-6 DNA methylase n=1 Tax=Nocardiopsis sp. FR4 TaxID=2605985 RepID=UPI0013581639|nr:N-6 DNA methylase [Nocardiopsis sp. FR4]
MAQGTGVTAADIARIAQVSRTTVSNWRRRHEDFPRPVGGAGNRALFDRTQVEAWLARGGRLPERAPHELVWEQVRAAAGEGADPAEVVADAQEFLLDLSRGGAEAAGTAGKRLTARPGGDELARALREAATTPERAREFSDHLHDAYVDSLGGKAHITPGSLADLMAALAGVGGGEVLDPACGGGTLLRAAADAGATGLHGQETAAATARLARARLGLHTGHGDGNVSAQVTGGDSLTGDAFPGRRFDAVLCNPPFNQRDWGADQLAYDERWAYGVPPRSESELAWVQHCLAHTRPGGLAVLLMPPAAASRPSGRRIRRELLRRGALRAVLALPVGAAAPVHVGLQVWVLHQPDPASAVEPRILFVDTAAGTEEEAEDGERRPVDWEGLRRSVTRVWRDFLGAPAEVADQPGFCRAVPAIELLDDSVDLTPHRHLPVAAPEMSGREAGQWSGRARRRLLRVLEDTRASVPGHGWAGREAAGWRMTTVADLARSGALTLYRAPSSGTASPPGEEESGPGGLRVLTLADVLGGRTPSGRPDALDGTAEPEERVRVRPGDVVVPSSLARRGPYRARVAGEEESGALLGANLHLLRPDPAHVDPWFLAGFLEDEDNLRRAGLGSTIVRVDLRKLSVPLLSLAEQRRYGAAFREIHEFRVHLDRVSAAAGELGEHLSSGLRAGLLAPPPPSGPGGAEQAERSPDTPDIRQT